METRRPGHWAGGGVYVHLPFCRVHCTYCAFAISTDLSVQDRYVGALVREIESVEGKPEAWTIYFGGGTPSRTSVENMERIVTALRQRFEVVEDAEVTLEANPEDVDASSLAAWRDLGVNRISIGVQAFHDGELAAIGRAHDGRRALEAVSAAVERGFRTSLDLILGLPSQTSASFRESVERAVSLGAGHLSLYLLDLEERTPLETQVSRGRVTLPDDERVAALYLEAIERLGAAGLHQYEISNFARHGEESRHNLGYWQRSEYRGLGMGAHSFAGALRSANTRDINEYIARSPDTIDLSEELGAGEIRREMIFLQLRQTRGMSYEELQRLTGEEAIRWTRRGVENGWVRAEEGRVALTPAGFLQSNELISQLF